MTDFAFTALVNDPPAKVETAALGPNASTNFGPTDVGKIVTIGVADNYILAADGADIEGFVDNLMPSTINDGFTQGGVLRNGRMEVEVAAAEVGTVDPGDEVVAGIQIALGTAGNPMVKVGTGATFKWRCIKIVTGTGTGGDLVLIERV